MLIAPAAILDLDAACGCAEAFEPHSLRFRPVASKVFWERHFHRSDKIDDLAHVFALGGGGGRECERERQDCEHNNLGFLKHCQYLSYRAVAVGASVRTTAAPKLNKRQSTANVPLATANGANMSVPRRARARSHWARLPGSQSCYSPRCFRAIWMPSSKSF